MRMLSPLSTNWSRRSFIPSLMVGDVFEDFDRIVDGLMKPSFGNTIGFIPTCDINETKDHYLFSFDMPGVKKEDIKIELKDNSLLVSGERHKESKDFNTQATFGHERVGYMERHERVYGKFERAFDLQNAIDVDKIEAHYEDGVLNIALPKTESAKGRSIQIQTGESGFFSKLLNSKKEKPKELKDVKVS